MRYEPTLMRIGDEERGTAWCEAHYGSDGAGFFEVMQDIAPADQAALDDEALCAGRRDTGKPWAFDPKAIVAPVMVHHGEADTMTPVAHSRHTAGLIPGERLTIWPEERHISLITKIPNMAAEIVPDLDEPPQGGHARSQDGSMPP